MSSQDERERAEARANKARVAAREGEKARAAYEAESQALRDKTAKLRALRLAKEAAEAADPSSAARPAPAGKSGAKATGAKSPGTAASPKGKKRGKEKPAALGDWLSGQRDSGRHN